MERIILDIYLHTLHTHTHKLLHKKPMATDLNVRAKPLRSLSEYKGEYIHHFGVGEDFFTRTRDTNSQKMDKLTAPKLKKIDPQKAH